MPDFVMTALTTGLASETSATSAERFAVSTELSLSVAVLKDASVDFPSFSVKSFRVAVPEAAASEPFRSALTSKAMPALTSAPSALVM